MLLAPKRPQSSMRRNVTSLYTFLYSMTSVATNRHSHFPVATQPRLTPRSEDSWLQMSVKSSSRYPSAIIDTTPREQF